ncbi:hypothetical protein ACHAXN_009294 [Cyclotella atomus]
MKASEPSTQSAYYILFLLLLSWTGSLFAFFPQNASRHMKRHHGSHGHHKADVKHQIGFHENDLQISPACIRSLTKPSCIAAIHSKNGNDDGTPAVTGVTLKMAFDSSPSWGVAETSPTSERFTSPESLDMVHRLRRESDAVLVGRGTVERDDCSLTVRRVEIEGEQPVRVVLDPMLKLLNGDKQYAVLKDGLRTIIYHSVAGFEEVATSDDVTLVELAPDSKQQCGLSLTDIVQDLSSRGLKHIMVEGGPSTAIQFLDAKLVDRAILIRASVQFKRPIPAGFNEDQLKEAGLTMIGTANMGGDTVEYWVREKMEWPTTDLSSWP